MQRYFIKLAYDGTAYHGWQVQPNAISVQEVIEDALSVILQEKISITGCGRTDTGVHAREYYAHFDCSNAELGKANELLRLNRYLPGDIAFSGLFPVHPEAHTRFDAVSRTYEYLTHTGKDPFLRNYSLELQNAPDLERMNKACQYLFNYTDFTSFAKLHTDNKTNDCKIMKAEWTMHKDQYIFTIKADRFLRNMVRAVVGTLMHISNHTKDPEYICEVIEAKNRSVAGQSVPAHALYLAQIEYPKVYFSHDKVSQ